MDDADRERAIQASIETTAHRDPRALCARLDAWLAARWPGARTSGHAVPGGSGASSELFIVAIEGTPFAARGQPRDCVLRLAPAWSVYPVVDLAQQATAMRAGARQAPVPAVHAVETDPRPLGGAFVLMERRHGRGAPDWPSYVLEGWIRELDPASQRRLWIHGIEALVRLHDTALTPAETEALRLPGAGGTALARLLDYWELFLERIRAQGAQPVLEDAVASLRRDAPAFGAHEALVWGDASLRNMLFEGLRPVALLDFEFAHAGLHGFDVAFYALMDHVMARGFAGGAPRLPGFPGVQETLDLYESLGGRRVEHRDYLLRTALTYMALSTTRVYQRLAAGGRIPAAEVATNPPLALLGELMAGGALPA